MDHRRPCDILCLANGAAAQVSISVFTNYVGFVLGDKATFNFQTKTWFSRRLEWLCDFAVVFHHCYKKTTPQYSNGEMHFRFNTAKHSCAQLSLQGSREGCFPIALFCSHPLGMINMLVLQNDVV